MEPDESCKRIGGEDAVVLVPGLVFDRKGNRYGYGGGYYDRYFARFPKLSRMAVAFEGQIEEQLAVLPPTCGCIDLYGGAGISDLTERMEKDMELTELCKSAKK